MRKLYFLFILLFTFSSVISMAQAGALDRTFSGDGIVTTSLGGDDAGQAIAVQADGKILVAGYSHTGSTFDFAIIRYNVDGTLDATFDGDGKVLTDFGMSHDYAYAIAIQSNGKIVVAGYSGTNNDFAVVRYNNDGTLDVTFDGDGKLTTAIGTYNDIALDIAIQSDGKILVAGQSQNTTNDFAIVRYNNNGTLDTSFDFDGKLTTNINSDDYARAVAIQTDGKIVLVGGSSGGLSTLVRYNTDGALDETFSGDGKSTNIGADLWAVAIQKDGKIAVAGATYSTVTNFDFTVARYNTNGTLDPTFNGDGKVITAIGPEGDFTRAINIQADGKIVVAGYNANGWENDFALARYNMNGTLDAAFDTDGVVVTKFASSNDQGYAMVFYGSRIYVAGESNNDFAVAAYINDERLTFYQDADGDGFGNPNVSQQASIKPTGYVTNNTDCNDSDNTVYPGATELCDGKDNDCNSVIDDVFIGGVVATWNATRQTGNPLFSLAATNYSEASQFIPSPIKLSNGDVWVYVMGHANNRIYGYKSTNGGTSFTLQGVALDKGSAGSWDDAYTTMPYALYDEVSNTIHLYYSGGQASSSNSSLGHATASGSSPMSFSKDAANPMVSPTSFMSKMGISHSYGLSLSSIIKKDGVVHFHGTYVDDSWTWKLWRGTGSSLTNISTAATILSPASPSTLVQQPSVFKLGSTYYMIYTTGHVNTGEVNERWLQTAYSIDLINWYQQSTALLSASGEAPAGWESKRVLASGLLKSGTGNYDNPVEVNGKYLLYYSGTNFYGSDQGGLATISPATFIPGTGNQQQATFYRDFDNDGFGNAAVTIQACSAPSGYVTNRTDCNDNDNKVYPGAWELCDGKDNNCNGIVDDVVITNYFFQDLDRDGYGNPASMASVQGCTAPTGYVTNRTDCNDFDNTVYPGAPELCDGKDNNCDGRIDESGNVYYRDADNDGFGNRNNFVFGCTMPTGYVSDTTDCDDNDNTVYPGARELCDGKDNNCDGVIDNELTFYYRDADGDMYGDPNSAMSGRSCTVPFGYVTNNSFDCNDNDRTIYPGAPELCDGKDNNCNGTIDEGVKTTYYRDLDNDGYGNAAVTTQACSKPTGYVTNSTDCNDNDNTVYPGAWESCDGKDNNCDGRIDNELKFYYRDADGDMYGDPNSIMVMEGMEGCMIIFMYGYVTNFWDCNDNDNTVYPGAPELCDRKDNNCNGIIDEQTTITYYRDLDGDNYGNPSVTTTGTGCTIPVGYVSNNTDCNDNDKSIYPGAPELCDGKDNNCNGITDEGVKTTYYRDADGDGFGNASVFTQACSVPAGYITNSTDCNDSDNSIYPGALELCDGKDNNCNGTTDEGVKTTFYRDADGDGFGNAAASTQACSATSGYVTNSTDCNDGDNSIYPNAPELCDGKDNNCNGTVDEGVKTIFYRDSDGDGFGNGAVTVQACSAPAGYVTNSTECNDSDNTIYPGAPELCDGKDNNCNGTTDEGCVTKPSITINDIEVYESVGTAVLTVSLSNAASTPVEITYTTVDGTAISKGTGRNPQIDYNAAKGTLIIPAGSLTGTISISIVNDGIAEQAEFFEVKLSLGRSVNATISKATGKVTILNGSGPATTKGGINEIAEEFKINQLSIHPFPNPSSDAFTIIVNSNSQEKIAMRIYDLNGKLIQVRNNLSAGQEFKFGANYRNGGYYVVVLQGKERRTVKLIKVAK